MQVLTLHPTHPMDIGFIPGMAGPGCLVTVGGGRHSITGDGITIRFTVGYGYPITNGALRG